MRSRTYRGTGTLVTNLALPNGSRITNAFDNVGRLTMTRLRSSGGTTLNTHSYVNNQGHQRTRQTRTDGSYADYTHDNIGQLKTAIGTGGHSTENLGYVYDAAWNLTTRTNYGTSQAFAVNVKNELTTAVGLTCTYDANGNMVSRVYDSNGPKVYYYVYDDENQLIEMRTDTYYTSAANRFKTEWVYDGFGRVPVRKEYYWYTGYEVWALSEEVRYLYDGRRVIQERNSGNTPTVSYTRGLDLSGSLEGAGGIGGLLGRSHGYSGGTWSTHNHYHADGGGNITYLVNSSQAAEAWYRYDPYGRTMAQSTGSLTTANVYRFSSKEIHAKSGMYYYGYRFYEPHLQRWVNRDPAGEAGGVNLYGFVLNAPLEWVDAFGLFGGPAWDNYVVTPDFERCRNQHQDCPPDEPTTDPGWKPDKYNWGNTDPSKGHVGNCYRKQTGGPVVGLGGAQCCYVNGKLNELDQGTYDYISPGDSLWTPRTWGHIIVDVIPPILWPKRPVVSLPLGRIR